MANLQNFKNNITQHLNDLHSFYVSELYKAEKELEENPRAQWAKMNVLRAETHVQSYKTILTHIKIGTYEEDSIK